MTRYKIHNSKVETAESGEGGDLPDITERSLALDEEMNRRSLVEPKDVTARLDMLDDPRGLVITAHLRHGEVGDDAARVLKKPIHIGSPRWMVTIVYPHPYVLEAVLRGEQQLYDELAVGLLGAVNRTVLAVKGNIEDRTELSLELKRFSHEFLGAGVVVANRDDRVCRIGR